MTPKTQALHLFLLLGCVVVDAFADHLTTNPFHSLESSDNPHFDNEASADIAIMSPSFDIFDDGFIRDEFGHIVPEFDCTIQKYIKPLYKAGVAGVYTPIAHLAPPNATHSRGSFVAKAPVIPKPCHGRNFQTLQAQTAATKTSLLWPDATVSFKWHQGIVADSKTQYEQAMATLQQLSTIRFKEVGAKVKTGYLLLRSDQGCQSVRNYPGPNASPSYSSSNSACAQKATYLHELLHVLGMDHTQTDQYRDDFVKIIPENIQNTLAARYQFQKRTGPNFDDPGRNNVLYAYDSIMHYSRFAFSLNGKDTIQTLDPQYQNVIGQRQAIVPADIINLEEMYSQRAKYRYEKVPNNAKEVVKTIAIYTDVYGVERVVPANGFVWTKPGAELPFLFASNSRTHWLYMAGVSGKMYTITNSANSSKSLNCSIAVEWNIDPLLQIHTVWGKCWNLRELIPTNQSCRECLSDALLAFDIDKDKWLSSAGNADHWQALIDKGSVAFVKRHAQEAVKAGARRDKAAAQARHQQAAA